MNAYFAFYSQVQRGWLKSVKETNWGKPTCVSIFHRALESRDQKKSELSDNEADFTPAEIQTNTTMEDIEKAFISGEEVVIISDPDEGCPLTFVLPIEN